MGRLVRRIWGLRTTFERNFHFTGAAGTRTADRCSGVVRTDRVMDLDADEVERWLCEKAPQDLVERVIRARLQHRTGSLTVGRAKRASMTSEMFNTWLASSPIKRSKSPNR